MEITVTVEPDGADFICTVRELPGCLASGRTLSELHEALAESVGLYLWDGPAAIEPAVLAPGLNAVRVHPVPAS